MTNRETLLSMGMETEELDNHYSDLYVLKNDISTKFVNGLCVDQKRNVTTFVSQIDKKVWYDMPFMYEEYYEKRKKEMLNKCKGFGLL
jgi:hypothetical protein